MGDIVWGRFRGLFVFAYDVLGDRAPLPAEELFEFRGSLYGFIAVPLLDYAGHARPISPRWDTWAMPAAEFRKFARPLAELLGLPQQMHHGDTEKAEEEKEPRRHTDK